MVEYILQMVYNSDDRKNGSAGGVRVADCQDLFMTFHGKIHLGSEQKERLRTSRNALRDKIKKHFAEELEVSEPSFYGQGSYMMNTGVNPQDGEYDIDDGIYLNHLKDVEEEEWPTPGTVHRWIVDATEGHTTTPPVDKNTCVRVIYKGQYHVDFPIYIMTVDNPKLAHKALGWVDSDPKAFTTWFRGEVREKGEQLRRIVQYLKAWKDETEGTVKFPSGMLLTILASDHYVSDDAERDDAALVSTAKAIHEALSASFSTTKPVVPHEELLADWSDTRRDGFLSRLSTLVNRGAKALEEEDKVKASEEWIKVFGSRFPKHEPPKGGGATEAALRTSAPAVLGNHGRSASPR